MSPKVCYLCGEEIKKRQEGNKDHIIPRQLFRALNDEAKRNLITLTVHKKCNEHYQEDEKRYSEYIKLATANIARYNPTAEQIFLKTLWDGRERPGNHKLTQKTVTLNTIDETEEERLIKVCYKDLILTSEESTSIHNVIWNIVRGLYYVENKRVLRKEIAHKIIPSRIPMILPRGNRGIVGAIANFDYFRDYFPDELDQFYQIQEDLESEPNQPKTQHPQAFNYRYKKYIGRNEEICELQFCEDILQVVRYKLQT